MSRIDKLRLVSYLAPNMFWFYKAVGEYLARVLDVEIHIVQSQHDPLSDPVMLQEQLDVAFICGLPFVRLNRSAVSQLQAIAAPVMQASRYQNGPVYFSDIIVKADSSLISFDDLIGKTFCFNDPGSNSGYNMMLHRLAQRSADRQRSGCCFEQAQSERSSSFFGKAIQSGSHQRSIELVVKGVADCSAIDSTVLEQELRDAPELSNHLRIIESIGPCPMPPVVTAKRLGSEFIDCLQSALVHPDTELQSAMDRAQIQRYVSVQCEDYAPIAMMYDAVVGC